MPTAVVYEALQIGSEDLSRSCAFRLDSKFVDKQKCEILKRNAISSEMDFQYFGSNLLPSARPNM